MTNPNDCLFILDPTKGYQGNVHGTALKDESGVLRVCYSGTLHNEGGDNLTIDEYRAQVCPNATVYTWEELEPIIEAWKDTKKTDPQEITEADYWEMLEVLPPSRWHSVPGFQVFHVCEHISGDLVAWYASGKGKFYTWTDSCYVSDPDILTKLQKVTK